MAPIYAVPGLFYWGNLWQLSLKILGILVLSCQKLGILELSWQGLKSTGVSVRGPTMIRTFVLLFSQSRTTTSGESCTSYRFCCWSASSCSTCSWAWWSRTSTRSEQLNKQRRPLTRHAYLLTK